MKKILALCLLLTTTFTVKAQQLSFDETVETINAIFKENKLSYYVNKDNAGRYVKKIAVNINGKVTVIDSIRADNVVLESTCHHLVVTFNLFEFEEWKIYSVYAYLKDKDKQIYGRILGIREPDLIKLKTQFDKLRALCTKEPTPSNNLNHR